MPTDTLVVGADFGLVIGQLLAIAEQQEKYWFERQSKEKSYEDAIDEDGNYTLIGEDAAQKFGYCNGRYSEAAWWLSTIRALVTTPRTDLPEDELAAERILLAGGLHAQADLRNGELHHIYEPDANSETGRYHCGRLSRSAIDRLAQSVASDREDATASGAGIASRVNLPTGLYIDGGPGEWCLYDPADGMAVLLLSDEDAARLRVMVRRAALAAPAAGAVHALVPREPTAEITYTEAENTETYEIGQRDGYQQAVQDIDRLTGGDGEYVCSLGAPSERHCPTPEAMIERIVARFEAARPAPAPPAGRAPAGDAEVLLDRYRCAIARQTEIVQASCPGPWAELDAAHGEVLAARATLLSAIVDRDRELDALRARVAHLVGEVVPPTAAERFRQYALDVAVHDWPPVVGGADVERRASEIEHQLLNMFCDEARPYLDRAMKAEAELDALRGGGARGGVSGIYMASKAVHGPRWRDLRDAGWPIVSTWIDEAEAGRTEDWADLWDRCASEPARATVTILYAKEDEVLKGALAEVGAALSHGRRVIVVGPINHTWMKHRNVYRAADLTAARELWMPWLTEASARIEAEGRPGRAGGEATP